MQNIVIVGYVQQGYRVDNQLSWFDVLKNVNIANLNEKYRDLYFASLYRELKDAVTRTDEPPLMETYKIIFEYLDKYFSAPFTKVKFNEQEFDEVIAGIKQDSGIYQLLSNKSTNVVINSSVTLIHTPGHVCSQQSALILPLIIDQIKHLENPVLVCSKEFIVDCDQEDDYDQDGRYYKISDQFFRNIQRECIEHNIQYIEYIGCWQDIYSKRKWW